MNSFRIGVIGITVDHWGIAMAEGFLHAFEGWFIFIACVAILFLEVVVLNYMVTKRWALGECFDLDQAVPPETQVNQVNQVKNVNAQLTEEASVTSQVNQASGHEHFTSFRQWRIVGPVLSCLGILSVFAFLVNDIGERQEIEPYRKSFDLFPLVNQQWFGREGQLEADVVNSLKLSDYIVADYSHPDYAFPVNFYVAYYASQRKGASVHSPQSCIPGSGWVMKSIDVVDIAPEFPNQSPLLTQRVNRVVIQKGNIRQLVYYWFQQRGRIITNEYKLKWYIFLDALTQQRTDGALVRLVVPVTDNNDIVSADAQLSRFIHDFNATLTEYIPE